MNLRNSIASIAVLAFLAALACCETVKPLGTTTIANVQVSDGSQVVVEATADTDAAIRELRLDRFDEARKLLDTYVAAHPKDRRAWFALGVCQENLKEYQNAMDSYAKANANMGGAGKNEYVAGYLRMKDKVSPSK